MRKRKDKLKLGAFLMATGHHIAAWRHPRSQPDAGANFRHYVSLAQAAERAKFDMIFFADNAAVGNLDPPALRRSARADGFEPLTLLSALSAVTSRIGLVATVTTTYNEPYHVARKFASLDLISGGRSGWNLVTSANESEARNFGRDSHPVHADRYDRAREFARVVTGLWDSWDEDAFLRDPKSGIFFDGSKLHRLDHRGEHFAVQGPLNVARSPQGRPVLVQAGSSEAGIALAAETAEVIFTAQQTLAEAQAFYADVKGRLGHFGRSPDTLKIMPGILPVIGRTREEAEEKYQELQSLIHPEVGLSLLSTMLGGVDLSGHPIDGPLPDLPETNSGKSRQRLLVDLAQREGLSIRDLYLRIAGARGHWTVLGTAADIADQLEERFLHGGADGFNVMPPTLPGGLDDFIEQVLPELRRRGLFRTEYEGGTLRENLGLGRPAGPGAAPPITRPAARALQPVS